MKEKKIKFEKIKKKYLRKLSVELIKRGVANEQIKSTLEDVSFSLDGYTIEFKPKNLEELANQFGSPIDFCDNNSLIRSKVGLVGQISLITLMICSVLVVPILAINNLYSVYLLPRAIPTATFTQNTFFLGVNGVNSGYGIIGTIFGLNVFIWMLYQFYKDKFSQNDIRETIKGVILVLYWFLVVFCFSLILHSYISQYVIIADMWNQNMQLIILEGIIRWGATFALLIITATFYTKKFCKHHLKKNEDQKKYMIDNIGMLVSVFILTGFVSPGPGMGIIIIAIGIGVIFLRKLNGRIWFIGLLSLLLQIILSVIEIIIIEIEALIYHFRRLRIIFGFLTVDGGNQVFSEAIIALCLVIIWSIFGLRVLKKNKQKILPRFIFPKGKIKIISMLIVILALVSVLGTQPQKVRFPLDINFYQNEQSSYLEIEQSFRIPGRGKVFISIYTYIEQIETITYSNGTVLYKTFHLTGTWYLTWTPLNSSFRTFRIDGNFENYTKPSYMNGRVNVSIQYIVLNVNESGVIKYYYRAYTAELPDILPYFQMQYSAAIPWLPNWHAIVIFVCVIILFFFEWDEKALQPLLKLKKGDD